VRRGGYLYIAILDSTGDGSSLDYLDSSNWEVVIAGDNPVGSWVASTSYALGDLVTYRGTLYRANFSHIADISNFPGDNGEGKFYWDVVLLATTNVGMSVRGDLLTYGLSRALVGDGSTLGESAVPLGNQDELLVINNGDEIGYKVWGNVARVRYVSTDDTVALDDITDPDRGINPFKPWRTVRFACEQVEAEGTAVGATMIKLSTGLYEEVLPIIVTEGVTIKGDELRATTIQPNLAGFIANGDRPYRLVALDRISDIIQDVLSGTLITKSPGNTETQVVLTTVVNVSYVPPQLVYVSYVPPQYNPLLLSEEIYERTYEVYQSSTVTPLATAGASGIIQGLIEDISDYINFYLASTGSDPAMTSTNTASTNVNYANAVTVLEANKNFIAAEVSAFLAVTYPTYVFDTVGYKRDVRAYIDAFKYDIIYTGNYKSLFAGRYYKNAVLGSASEDMFYVRNATGLHLLTVKGLTGTLNPPGVFELYQRPTGGAYVSLDPGWGPADQRTWITSRSCYVQNVTTFGDNCIGQKIDGSLHNGGNRSIVSNDFTQVISDGIGAWVLNGGRAELVSVFTYYAQIGMFAETGGIIRATNGNSSYGTYGAIADGNDPGETPAYATVNTRTTQARIVSAFAGEVNDEILLLEFSHAGENYTNASYTFLGSGTQADVAQEEFRDGAVFEMMVRSPENDTGATAGGRGYSIIGNNVQTGDTTSITLATNSTSTEAELVGLRVVITSGDGTGQYAIASSYNTSTKVLNVVRESNGQPGWDHVISGYPIATFMSTSARYIFEPRITFAEPDYSSGNVNLGFTTTWNNIAYGETLETYANIQGAAGTGTTVGVVPVAATWNIIKNARAYTVTLVQGGAGYADEQTIIIDGTTVGGITVENDIEITVKTISDDSTNSILTFEYTGIAQSGRFVATAQSGSVAAVSVNGSTWTTANLPVAGNWSCIAAGGNKFVAIQYNSNIAASSTNGVTWVQQTIPATELWNSVAYGGGVFVAIAGGNDAGTFSTDGINWTLTTLPNIGDSTFNQWVDIAYGKEKFVAVANSGNFVAVGTYSSISGTISWSAQVMDVIADSSTRDWRSISYGNQRFVAISGTGEIAYSFDTTTWYPATAASQDGSTAHNWKQIRYGQGVFFAVGDNGVDRIVGADTTAVATTFAATSADGIVWTSRSLSSEHEWKAIAFGNPDISLGDSTISNSRPLWVAIANDSTSVGSRIFTGARAIGRAIVADGKISSVRIWSTGSGYTAPPGYTITDPGNTQEAYINPRIGNGVLAQPEWKNRGTNYRTSSTVTTITGDGYADVIPNSAFITISGLTKLPRVGSQFRFRGETNYYTVATIELESVQLDTTITGTFRISPPVDYNDYIEHSSQVEVREQYSQVRITGHDFLDVGSGNFLETNYPEIYSSASPFFTAAENEVLEVDGGRVFYTSTDQSGNFRTGELFAVEQATGVVTISADYFDFQGLTELALGGVRLGGSGAVIREFSTDPLFLADSNNIVPTQRAIKSYLQTRLNVGGSDLLTASFIAGTVRVGPNYISTTVLPVPGVDAGLTVRFPVFSADGASRLLIDFSGADQASLAPSGISGSWLANNMFYRSFRN
jgi:hypothetical protein